MNKQRRAMLIAAILGILGTFMPWIKISFVGSVSGTQCGGWNTFVLFLITIIMLLIKDRSVRVKGKVLYISLISVILTVIIGIWKIYHFKSVMNNLEDDSYSIAFREAVQIGFGIYWVIIAGIAVVVSAFLIKDNKKDSISQ